MVQLIIFLLSLYQLNTLTFSESIDPPNFADNPLKNDEYNPNLLPELPPDVEDYPIIKTSGDEAEIDFDDPITSLNIDYLNRAIILQFKKQRQRKDAFNKNFMRFGRSDESRMRFIKRQDEGLSEQPTLESFRPVARSERSNGAESIRDSRGDNFMRFGRSTGGSKNLMRFGRSPNDFMRFGRSPSDFMRFGRSPKDFMRFGRSPSDFMRFGRSPSDFMRFGRSPSDFMRFGRSPSDFMRFGRSPSDFMRFGRSPSDFMRLGRSSSDFMRFGRSPSDFMRFGRSPMSNKNPMRLGRSDQGFMRFGKADKLSKSDIDNNFMRFGRLDSFMRLGRAPTTGSNNNFMRLGKRQREDPSSSSSTTVQSPKDNNEAKTQFTAETTTIFPYQELENDLDDILFLNDIPESMNNDEN